MACGSGLTLRGLPPNLIDTCAERFESSSWAKAFSQKVKIVVARHVLSDVSDAQLRGGRLVTELRLGMESNVDGDGFVKVGSEADGIWEWETEYSGGGRVRVRESDHLIFSA